ncbi:hypothetical protein B484DRAFT_406397, partial [Ochromonadaceae sp. CCMP2298]
MASLNSAPAVYLYFLSATFGAHLLSYLTASILAAYSPSEVVALAVFPAQFLFLATFMGYSVKLEDLPSYWSWAPPLDYPRWLFEGVMVNFWEQYDTGDVLASYDFSHFDKSNLVWIFLLFYLLFSIILYWGLLPARNSLTRVEDARAPTVLSVLSKQSVSMYASLPPDTSASAYVSASIYASVANAA